MKLKKEEENVLPVYECFAYFIYSGAYHDEEAAAHAYDLAALKYWGQETILNFPVLLSITSSLFVIFFYSS